MSPENGSFPGADALGIGGRRYRLHRNREVQKDPAGSETSCTHATFSARKTGDPAIDPGGGTLGPHWEPERGKPVTHGCGKSDTPIVLEKPSNEGMR